MYGGGAAEISSSIAVSRAADDYPGIEQYAMRAFASALDAIPLALAENSGLSPIDALADVKSRQVTEQNYRLGVDCVGSGENGKRTPGMASLDGLLISSHCDIVYADMKAQSVFDPLVSKRQQYLLATQLVRAVLKIDDVITDQDY